LEATVVGGDLFNNCTRIQIRGLWYDDDDAGC
jgi:hypothetical protein